MKFFLPTLSLVLLIGGFLAPSVAAQEALPLLEKGGLEYLGAFRLPREGFSFGGYPLAWNPGNDSLFVGTRDGGVGEVSIPTPLKSPNIDSLPFATAIQGIRDPLAGGRSVLPESNIRGLLVSEGKLYGTAMIFYDANNNARVSHYSRSTDLAEPSGAPLKALWQAEKSGFVAGWLASVPPAWQSLLGGDIISGNCCVPIVSRTSHGPSAFAWRTRDFEKPLIPATPLLYYPGGHETLGPWSGANEVYGGTTVIGGMAIPEGTRSLLYFGLNGTGAFCYGTGGTGGECADPLSSDKGQHAYPYNYQVWAYDLNDLAAVRAGRKNPWDVEPYAIWTLDEFPGTYLAGIGGVAYDPESQTIYLAQARADQDGYASRALVHAFRIKIGAGTPPPAGPKPAPVSVTPSVPEAVMLPRNVSEEKPVAPHAPKEGFLEALIRFLLKLKSRV